MLRVNYNVLLLMVVLVIMGLFFYNVGEILRPVDHVLQCQTLVEQAQRVIDENVQIMEEQNELLNHTIEKYEQALQKCPERVCSLPSSAATTTTTSASASPNRELPIIPVVVVSCKRANLLKNTVQTLLKTRPSDKFPIIVSQDCDDPAVLDLLQGELEKDVLTIRHIKSGPADYDAVARHYGWLLTQVFDKLNYEAVIMVEDDLTVSVDFFEYFAAVYPLFKKDSSILCASSWNDNGIPEVVRDADRLERTDVFPGLGWMTTRDVWLTLREKWPKQYWDEYMRESNIVKERSCIRPEISRNRNTGKVGVSVGQFFDSHIAKIKFNEEFVKFTEMDLSYLIQENYDAQLLKEVREAKVISLSDIDTEEFPKDQALRVIYKNHMPDYQNIAHKFGLMDDEKNMLPRTSYKRIVPFYYKNTRVYATPPDDVVFPLFSSSTT